MSPGPDVIVGWLQRSAAAKTPVATAKVQKPPRVAQAKVPAPKPAQVVAAKPVRATPAQGNWRIQLGAFGQRATAEALYRRVAGKAALSGRSPIYVAVGSMTRLQVGPFESRGAAAAACGTLGTACFPVPAK